ncbi:transposase domain protein [Candidatus Erwinia dacicola]|uniref:Transposase domain protein n=1 Tax=Candidatus Erwinia dacicola TaxID=252393 RepID=A0A328TQK7_9GAMM|nr:transposase domain protein [Candidatus Erwinia dacicola]
MEEIWRSAVIHLLRDSYAQIMPGMLPVLEGTLREEDPGSLAQRE